MKKYILLTILAISFSSFAQNTSDYRSNPSGEHGNFDDLRSWQKFTYFLFLGPFWLSPGFLVINFDLPPSISNTDSTNMITIRNGDEIVIDNTVTVYNITVDAGAFLKIDQGDTLFILKNLIVNGTLINDGVVFISEDLTIQNAEYVDSGTIVYAGTTSKFLKVSTYNNLVINNSNLTLLSKNVRINGNLTLLNGNISLGQHDLTLSENAIINGTPDASKMIIASGSGKLKKEFSTIGSFTFPIGDNTGSLDYSPVTLNFTSGIFANSFVEINLADSKHPENKSTSDYISRYWKISQTGISDFSCDITLSYVSGDVTGNEANIYTGKYDGNEWQLFNAANAAQNQLSATVSSFSDFTGGEQKAFPVELISFSSNIENGKIVLHWKTATEVNNYGFEIERTYNSSSWQKIDFIKGYGNSNSEKNYSYTDNGALMHGEYSYRLKQIDIDGGFEYSKEINIVLNASENYSLTQNYPNPFNPVTKIEYNLPAASNVELTIYNTIGMEIIKLLAEKQNEGKHSIIWNADNFPSGVYYYKLKAGEFTQVRKMLLLK